MDPVGANAGLFKPLTWPPPRSTGQLVSFRGFEDMDLAGGGCTLDKMPIPCGIYNDLMGAGAIEAEFSGVTNNGKNGKVPVRAPIRPEGLGLFRVWLPDGARDNDQHWDLYLFAVPQNSFRVPLPSIDVVKQRIRSGACNDYIAKLLAKASEMFGKQGNKTVAKDGLDLIDKINNIVLQDTLRVSGYGARGTVTGSILGNNAAAPGTATIIVDQKFVFPNDPDGSAYRIHYWQEDYIDTIIHEMLHLAGTYSGYDDRQLAEAAHTFPGADPELPAAPTGYKDALGYQHNSGYYDRELRKHCGGQKR